MERSVNEWMDFLDKMPPEGPGIRGIDFLNTPETSWNEIGGVPKKGSVLDVGCGHGRMAVPFINKKVKYYGVDILPKMIEWNVRAFKGWNNIKFEYIRVFNAMYNSDGVVRPEDVVLNYKNIDIVIALSLFTHLETKEAATNYVNEICKVMNPGGMFVSSWFVSPPNNISTTADRTVYDKNFVLNLFSGFEIKNSFGGESGSWHDQMTIIAEKKWK